MKSKIPQRTVMVVTSPDADCMVVRTLTDERSALQIPLTAKVVNDSENGAAFFFATVCASVIELCRILLFSTSVFQLLVVIFAWKWCGADPTRWAR